jgi:hypothetical protein
MMSRKLFIAKKKKKVKTPRTTLPMFDIAPNKPSRERNVIKINLKRG